MTINDFRRLALGMPEASESQHMGHPDFRVRGKIFATLGYPDGKWGMVKLKPEQQEALVSAEPAVFVPVKGAWGRGGATSVCLLPAKIKTLRLAMAAAWQNVAPSKLVRDTRKPPKGRSRRKAALALLAVALLGGGCYESGFPLDPAPKVARDPALVGTWRCLPLDADADEAPATVVVEADGERQYVVSWREGEKEPDRYRAYISAARVPRLLNVQQVQPGKTDAAWEFVRYSLLRPGVLELQVVSDGALRDVEKSPVAMRRAIERLQKRPDTFMDFCVCARAKDRE